METAPSETPAVSEATAAKGVPHSAPISAIVLSQDGNAALTRDTQDGLRLWRALDGSSEPLPLPMISVRNMAVTRDGATFRLAFVDATDQLVVGSVDAAGVWTKTGTRPPTQGVVDVYFTKDGKLVVLTRDHAIEVLDAEAKSLGKLSIRGRRITALVPALDGSPFAVLDAKEPATSPGMTFRGDLQRIELRGDEPTLAGPVRSLEMQIRPNGTNVAISSTGAIAMVHRDANAARWFVRMIDANGVSSDVDLGFFATVTPSVGFVAPDRIHVVSREASKAYEIELGATSPRPRQAPRNMGQTGAFAFGAGMRVASDGNWLAVHDLASGASRYLGYENFSPGGGASSGRDGRRAWLMWPDVVIEDAKGEIVARHSLQNVISPLAVAFLDETHLLVVGSEGTALVLDVNSGKVLQTTGVSGGTSEAVWDPSSRLLLQRTFASDVAVFRFPKDPAAAIEGPWLLSESAFRMGIRAGVHGDDVPIVWTNDGAELREYSIDMLRRDLTRAEQVAAKRDLPMGTTTNVLAVAANGEFYDTAFIGNTWQLVRRDAAGVEVKKTSLGSRSVQRGQFSPDGETLVLMVTDDGGRLHFLGIDPKTLDTKWSRALGGFFSQITFSPDGERLVSTVNGGGVELDLRDGSVAHRRCGLAFSVRNSPPPSAIFFADGPGVCSN